MEAELIVIAELIESIVCSCLMSGLPETSRHETNPDMDSGMKQCSRCVPAIVRDNSSAFVSHNQTIYTHMCDCA